MAFAILPSEVWCTILENLNSADDILAVYAAFPDIHVARIHHASKPQWLFEKIVLHLSQWLTPRDNLNCRQVCRKWKNGMDSILQSQLSTLPFTTNDDTAQGLSVCQPFAKLRVVDIIGKDSVCFNTISSLQHFLREMTTNSVNSWNTNPFIMRSVVITYGEESMEGVEGGNAADFWLESLSCLTKFGPQIWYFTIQDLWGDKTTFISFVQDALMKLPNLKSLKISYHGFDVDLGQFDSETSLLKQGNVLLSPASNKCLDTIYLVDTLLPIVLIDPILLSHCHLIRKLVIYVKYWTDGFGSMIPRLNDLTLIHGTVEQVSEIISSLNCTKLTRVGIDEITFFPNFKQLNLDVIMPLLSKSTFKQLKHLKIFCQNSTSSYSYAARKQLLKANHTIYDPIKLESICWLDLQIDCLVDDIDFLSAFPNLKKLQLWFPIKPRQFFLTCRSIWEITCPHLVVLYVVKLNKKSNSTYRWSCSRMEYENMILLNEKRKSETLQQSLVNFMLDDFQFFSL